MKNPRVQLAVGIAISLVFLYLALRGVDPQALWLAVRNFNWWWSVPFVALTILSMWVRAWRWHYLLLPTANLSTARLFGPLMAGFAINGLLPARLGEFARGYVLARRDNLPFTRIFGTIVVERIFDTLVLLALLAYVFSTLEIDPSVSYPYSTRGETSGWLLSIVLMVAGFIIGAVGERVRRGRARHQSQIASHSMLAAGALLIVTGVATFFLLPERIAYGSDYAINGAALKQGASKLAFLSVVMLAGALLLVWPAACRLIKKVLLALPLIPAKIKAGIATIIDTFAEGMQSLRSPKLILIVTAQSVLVWMLVAWSMQLMTYGFDGMKVMTLSEATALLVITCLAILIPAAPGYWGLMELGIKFGMVILAIDTDPNRVLAYALIVHALQYFPITGIGLFALWKSQVTMSEIRNERTDP